LILFTKQHATIKLLLSSNHPVMIRVLVPQQFYSAFGFSVISQIHTEKSVIIRVICERSLLNIGCLDKSSTKEPNRCKCSGLNLNSRNNFNHNFIYTKGSVAVTNDIYWSL